MKEKDIRDYTRRELLAIENFYPKKGFDSVVIVPTDELHDSGFVAMKFILLRNWEIVGAVGGGSDVVHINGIGGYGIDYAAALQKAGLIKIIGWRIDCLPGSNCVRLFTNKMCRIGNFVGSDFEVFVED